MTVNLFCVECVLEQVLFCQDQMHTEALTGCKSCCCCVDENAAHRLIVCCATPDHKGPCVLLQVGVRRPTSLNSGTNNLQFDGLAQLTRLRNPHSKVSAFVTFYPVTCEMAVFEGFVFMKYLFLCDPSAAVLQPQQQQDSFNWVILLIIFRHFHMHTAHD